MSSLRTWLGADAWQRFTRDHHRTRPFATKLVGAEALEPCDWDHLGQTLATHAADVRVVRRGESLSVAPPQSLADLHNLFGQDAGIALSNADLVSERVRAICAAVVADVPGNQRATMFATPEKTHSLAWHFDADELFIFQLAGSKAHHLRANTVVPSPQAPSGHNLATYPLETSPLLTIELHPGDFLYVPRGWWHMAHAGNTSLSLSIGVLGTPALAKPELKLSKGAVLRDRIRKVRSRLAKVSAAAEQWSTLTFKTLRR
jgi:ribosomal protein L16 Arg81 hydroxylase